MASLRRWSKDPFGRYVCVRDVHGLMLARQDMDFMGIHEEAAMVTPDGVPIATLGKLRDYAVERTAGPDLMLDALSDPEFSHFLYGGGEGVAQELCNRAKQQNPDVEIAGCETPPYHTLSESELMALAERINRSHANLVWIGLSTPMQERLMHSLVPHVSATLLGVGAAFDIHAGRIKRSPKWMQKYALEGVFRFLMEPRRLWYRYCVLAPQFLYHAAVEQMTGSWRN